MKAYVGVTDGDWYRFLAERPEISEVNFWQPSGGRDSRVLEAASRSCSRRITRITVWWAAASLAVSPPCHCPKHGTFSARRTVPRTSQRCGGG